jgi:peroxiredoxin
MTAPHSLFPRQLTPVLQLPLAGGGEYILGRASVVAFTLLVFYRGLHCPICKTQLTELEKKLPEFQQRGVDVVAVSADSRERAERTKTDWHLENLKLAYGLDLRVARAWSLYISSAKPGSDEPAYFTEPAIYLVRPDGTLYFGSVQTMPFARPHLPDILAAIDFVAEKNYPARGEVIELP